MGRMRHHAQKAKPRSIEPHSQEISVCKHYMHMLGPEEKSSRAHVAVGDINGEEKSTSSPAFTIASRSDYMVVLDREGR